MSLVPRATVVWAERVARSSRHAAGLAVEVRAVRGTSGGQTVGAWERRFLRSGRSCLALSAPSLGVPTSADLIRPVAQGPGAGLAARPPGSAWVVRSDLEGFLP
ncbi:hypothetical protein GCM10022237_29440 [Nocardioides ginsengisoli]